MGERGVTIQEIENARLALLAEKLEVDEEINRIYSILHRARMKAKKHQYRLMDSARVGDLSAKLAVAKRRSQDIQLELSRLKNERRVLAGGNAA